MFRFIEIKNRINDIKDYEIKYLINILNIIKGVV